MSKINDGGPAFPESAVYHPDHGVQPSGAFINAGGMTLRDYFAAQFLTGIALSACADKARILPEQTAEYAYLYADAMIAARGKEGA